MKASLRGIVWSTITLSLMGSLVLIGCSRSATAELLPDEQGQQEDAGDSSLDLDAQNATMQALLSTGLTQTAAAPENVPLVVETPEPSVESSEEDLASGGEDEVSVESSDDGDAENVGESDVISEAPDASMEGVIGEEDNVAADAEVDAEGGETVEVDAALEPSVDPAFTLPTTYIVQKGDWIYMIAREFNVEPRDVISANPGFDPNTVIPGQELQIPAPSGSEEIPSSDMPETGPAVLVAPASVESESSTYIVESGDTVFSIALRHGVEYSDLASANDISDPYFVYPGQVLMIP